MTKARVFTSFDYDHDEDLRNLLVGQARLEDSPFEHSDWSVKEPMTGDWKEKVRKRIRQVDQVLVICGEYTNNASGVGAELSIAKEEKKSHFLLKGRKDKACTKPTAASATDKMYDWTWDNLKKLIGGAR